MAATHSGAAKITLPSETEILITRDFDAPRHLVYKAWTTPDLVRRWWAGQRGELAVCDIDLEVGGGWRYAMAANEGYEVAFHGEYREIVPEERIVTTEVFEGIPDDGSDPVLNVITFTESDGRTTVDLLVQCPSQEVRDAIMGSGMEIGMQEQYDLLEQVAQSLR